LWAWPNAAAEPVSDVITPMRKVFESCLPLPLQAAATQARRRRARSGQLGLVTRASYSSGSGGGAGAAAARLHGCREFELIAPDVNRHGTIGQLSEAESAGREQRVFDLWPPRWL
jgi:hypothetical protein